MSIIILSGSGGVGQQVTLRGDLYVPELLPEGIYESALNYSTGYLSGSFTSDSDWYGAEPTNWINTTNPSTSFSTASIAHVKVYDETTVTFDFKMKGDAITTLDRPTFGDTDAGLVFTFAVYDKEDTSAIGENSLVYRTIYGGWHEWTEISCDLSVGDYLFVFSLDKRYLIGSLYSPLVSEWGEKPAGDTSTMDAWIRDIEGSPQLQTPYTISFTPGQIGGQPFIIDETVDVSINTESPSDGFGFIAETSTLDVEFTAETIGSFIKETVALLDIDVDTMGCGYAWTLPAIEKAKAIVIYTLTLTGSEDGTTDLTLPMSSFTANIDHNGPMYINAIVPNITAYETDINLRPNGILYIKKGYVLSDGATQLETILGAYFTNLQLTQDPQSSSGTLAAYSELSLSYFLNPAYRTLSNVQYRNVDSTGNTRARAEIDLFIKPRDIVEIEGVSVYISSLIYNVSDIDEYMEITGI